MTAVHAARIILVVCVKNLYQHDRMAVPMANSSPKVPPISTIDLPTWLISSLPRNPYLCGTPV